MRRRAMLVLLFFCSCGVHARCNPTLSCQSEPFYDDGDAGGAPPTCTTCEAMRVAAGDEHTCVVLREGSGATSFLACFGRDAEGQVTGTPGPDRVGLHRAPAYEGYGAQLGALYSCAETIDGVVCWGLGVSSAGPARLAPPDTEFTAGAAHACACDIFHTCACFGDNRFGQLGESCDGVACAPEDALPIAVELWITLAAGGTSTCQVGGHIRCSGTIEIDTDISVSLRAPAIGSTHACAVQDGLEPRLAYCWGDNASGQLGGGTFGGASATPIAVPAFDGTSYDVEVRVGGHRPARLESDVLTFGDPIGGHTCTRDATRVLCWGDNDLGQVGDGTTEDRAWPVQIAVGGELDSIALGGRHTCVISAGELYCWGDNARGQLGLDPAEVPFSAVPVRVPLDLTR